MGHHSDDSNVVAQQSLNPSSDEDRVRKSELEQGYLALLIHVWLLKYRICIESVRMFGLSSPHSTTINNLLATMNKTLEENDYDYLESQVGELATGSIVDPQTMMMNKTNIPTTQDPTANLVEADPPQGAETHQIMTFLDDAAVQEATLPGITSPEIGALVPASELRQHSIEDILSRPMLVSSPVWVVGTVQNTDLSFGSSTTLQFPEALIDNIDIVKDKIKNFTYLRADICIRVTVNATTFQSGKLLAYFAPFSGVVGNRSNLNEHLSAKTSFPYVILDAAGGNSGVLRIPYVSPFTHYNLITQQGDMGNLKLTVLNPLQTGTDANVSIFAWFENIDIGVPTDAARFAPENRVTRMTKEEQKMIARLIRQGYLRVSRKMREEAEALIASENMMESQVGEDREKSQKGIVTDTLEHVSALSRNAQNLPLVGDLFKPVEWLSNAAAKVSGALGYCKPSSVETQHKFQQVPGFGYTHATGLDQSCTLGAGPDNQVVPKPGLFGSNVDEMDIKFLTSRKNWLTSFNWSVDSTVSEILGSYGVAPGIINQVTGPPAYIEPTMLAFVSAPFKYWRGGLTYTLQVAKTSYHSGRLRISYIPSGKAGENYDANNCYTWTMDLRTSNQLEFTIPYVSNTQYKNLTLFDVGVAPDVSFTTGVLQIEVLNKLRAPDSVSSVIALNLWISGAEDYEVAVPTFDKYGIFNPNATTIVSPLVDPKPKEFVGIIPDNPENANIKPGEVPSNVILESQVLGTYQDKGFNDFTPASKMFEMNSSPTLEGRALSIGESMTSIRQLIKRFGYLSTQTRSDTTEVTSGTSFFGFATTSATVTTRGQTPLEYYSWIYRFYRGGHRYKAIVEPFSSAVTYASTIGVGGNITFPAQIPISMRATHLISETNTPEQLVVNAPSSLETRQYRGQTFTHYQYDQTNRVLEVTCPFYNNCHILPIMGSNSSTLTDIKYNNVGILFEPDIAAVPSGSNFKVHILEAAGDDFEFGWVVGQPTIIALPTA